MSEVEARSLEEEIDNAETIMRLIEGRTSEALTHLGIDEEESIKRCDDLISFIPHDMVELVDTMYTPVMKQNRTDKRVRDLFERYHALRMESAFLAFEYEKYKRHI